MKVLLDEDMPHDLRPFLTEHDVFTTQYMGWASIKNGALLALAEEHDFKVFVTADQNIPFQQNLRHRRFGVVVLSSNRWPLIAPRIDAIARALDEAQAGSLIYVHL